MAAVVWIAAAEWQSLGHPYINNAMPWNAKVSSLTTMMETTQVRNSIIARWLGNYRMQKADTAIRKK